MMGFNTLVMSCAFITVAIQMSQSFDLLREMGREARLPESHAYFKFISMQAELLYQHLAIALIVAFFVSTVVTLFLSHRLAGPIVRLKGHFIRIAESGKAERIQFRKNDFFLDLPPIVNSALERLDPHLRDSPSRDSAGEGVEGSPPEEGVGSSLSDSSDPDESDKNHAA